MGAAVAAGLTLLFSIDGTFAALYLVEIGLAAAFWLTLLALVRRKPSREPGSTATPRLLAGRI